MKYLLSGLAMVWTTCLLHAQVIYVSTLTNDLFRLDVRTCRLSPVTQTSDRLFDITFHPDGALYGITPGGELVTVDTNSGAFRLVHDFEGMNFNSLTSSADGILYTVGSEGQLWSYYPLNSTVRYLGNIGFPAAGDLTFRDGELYVAAMGDRIVRIDPDNPANSTIVIREDIPGDIFGIVSFAENCEAISTYAITDHLSDIYEIDFSTGRLSLICSLPVEVSGGASTYEFLGSSAIEITVSNMEPASCFAQSGAVAFDATGGIGALQYSLDGMHYSNVPAFTALAGGDYTLYVMDSIGCSITYPFSIRTADGPNIDEVLLVHESCNCQNGSITVRATGGDLPLQYSLDDGPFQSTPAFTGLTGGSYTLQIVDQSGCKTDTLILLASPPAATFTALDVVSSKCDSDKGSVTFIGAAGSPPFIYEVTGHPPQTSNHFNDLLPGEYVATMTDRYGCGFQQSFTILPGSSPAIESVVVHHATCGKENGSASIIATDQDQAHRYSIDGYTWQHESEFDALGAGPYTFYMMDAAGCIASYPAEVFSSMPIEFHAIIITPTACGEHTGAVEFELRHAAMPAIVSLNGQQAGSGNQFQSLAAGTYNLHVADAIGCSLDTMLIVESELCPVYIPNVFSPDGDGINDVFSLSAWDGFDALIESYVIYDRWGSIMYQAGGFQLQDGHGTWWDGTVDGRDAPGGVYAYQVVIRYDNGSSKVYAGDVTIVR